MHAMEPKRAVRQGNNDHDVDSISGDVSAAFSGTRWLAQAGEFAAHAPLHHGPEFVGSFDGKADTRK